MWVFLFSMDQQNSQIHFRRWWRFVFAVVVLSSISLIYYRGCNPKHLEVPRWHVMMEASGRMRNWSCMMFSVCTKKNTIQLSLSLRSCGGWSHIILDCEIWFCLLLNALGFWLSHNRRLWALSRGFILSADFVLPFLGKGLCAWIAVAIYLQFNPTLRLDIKT